MTWVLSRANRVHCWPLLSNATQSGNEITLDQNNKQSLNFASDLYTWDVFQQALSSDYKDIQGGTTREGIHIGAMAGTIDIVQRCYTGIVTEGDTLWLNPRLPRELSRLAFRLQYRHQTVLIEITQRTCTVTAGHASVLPINIGFKQNQYQLKAGE